MSITEAVWKSVVLLLGLAALCGVGLILFLTVQLWRAFLEGVREQMRDDNKWR